MDLIKTLERLYDFNMEKLFEYSFEEDASELEKINKEIKHVIEYLKTLGIKDAE